MPRAIMCYFYYFLPVSSVSLLQGEFSSACFLGSMVSSTGETQEPCMIPGRAGRINPVYLNPAVSMGTLRHEVLKAPR